MAISAREAFFSLPFFNYERKLFPFSAELPSVDDDLYEELALAFSELYKEDELNDDAFMREQAKYFLDLEGKQADIVIKAAREFRKLWNGRKPEWKRLITVN